MKRAQMRIGAAALVSVVVMSGSRVAMGGPVWCEMINGGADAGNLLTTAQIPLGMGPLLGLDGNLGGADKEDMYKIRITDPANFRARTVFSPLAGDGETDFDTTLWLFDENGHGILANDNEFGTTGPGSLLKSPATDGTGQTIPGPGIYYLCITGSGNSALSALFGIFDLISHDEISGPDGPGGLLPLIHWKGTGPTGHYLVHLEGAEFPDVPGPAGWGPLIAAAAMLKRRRRSR